MSSSSWINLDALWKIVVVGLLLGAGLPALFAVGLRALSFGSAPDAEAGAPAATGGNLAGRAVAVLCFAAVLAAIAWGIYSIVNQS
jgi:hypothetical protein